MVVFVNSGKRMLFRRRKPADFWERLRIFVWPRKSFSRSVQYFSKRVLRLRATPHAIAAGVAAGVFASFTPFVGFHFVIAAILSYVVAGNVIASAFGTAIGNPLTFPFIWASTLELGRFLITGSFAGPEFPMNLANVIWKLDIAQFWQPFIKPMLVGSIPIGIVFALGFYFATRWATLAFREKRRELLAERARKRAKRESEGENVNDGAVTGS